MKTIAIITTVATTLSIIGCFVIFATHKAWKEIRSNSRIVLLYITVADFLTAFGYLIGLHDDPEGISCVVQSFVTTMSSLISFFWTCCLALYLYTVSVNANYELGRRVILVFHFLSWPIPILISLTALLDDVLGESQLGERTVATGGWCWIKFCANGTNCSKPGLLSHGDAVKWMLFTGKFWEILSYFVITIAYIRIWYEVKKRIHQVENDSSLTMSRFRCTERRTIMIPVLYIFIRIWGTIRFLLFATGCEYQCVLEYLQAFGDSSQGFVNAVMFCLMTDKVIGFFQTCCRRHSEEEETQLINKPKKPKKYGAAVVIIN